jgi:hypothetical protein
LTSSARAFEADQRAVVVEGQLHLVRDEPCLERLDERDPSPAVDVEPDGIRRDGHP